MWTSSSPKGQSSQCSIQKSRISSAVSFLVPKNTGDLCPVIHLSHLNGHLVIPQFKMETQASVRSSIRESKWTMSIDIPDAYLHVPMARPAWKYLWFMVNGPVYQFSLAISPWEFTKAARWLQGLSSMFTWTVGLSAPPPPYRPELMPIWSCECCSTYAGWSISASLICHPASYSISSACNSVCVLTSWHPYPNWGQNPEHAGSLEIAPSRHRQGSPQTFGHVDLYGHRSAERSAVSPHNPVMGIRGLVSGDRVLVRQDFSHPDHSPSGGLVTLPCNAAGDLTECVRDWDHSLYKCLQPQIGAQLGSHELQGTLSRQ